VDSDTFWALVGAALAVCYLALVVYLGIDLVRRRLNPVAKIAWVVAFLAFPVFSVLMYAVVRGDETPYPGSPGGVDNLTNVEGRRLR
jgi:hypothetical protein